MNPSPNLFLIGPTGAGKTSIGRWLAAHYQLAFVDLDAEIERVAGERIIDLFVREGESGFRQREQAMLAVLCQRAPQVLSVGGGAVLAAANRRQLSEHGLVLWLQADVATQWARLRHGSNRPLLAAADPLAVLHAMAETREPLYRACADLSIATGTSNVSAAGKHCIELLDRYWQREPVLKPIC